LKLLGAKAIETNQRFFKSVIRVEVFQRESALKS